MVLADHGGCDILICTRDRLFLADRFQHQKTPPYLSGAAKSQRRSAST
jgi:hypothetical protein